MNFTNLFHKKAGQSMANVEEVKNTVQPAASVDVPRPEKRLTEQEELQKLLIEINCDIDWIIGELEFASCCDRSSILGIRYVIQLLHRIRDNADEIYNWRNIK